MPINVVEFEVGEEPFPTGRHVLIEVPSDEKTTSGGVAILSNERDRVGTCVGTVVKIGPKAGQYFAGDLPEHFALKVGNFVLFNRYSGTYLRRTDGRCYMMIVDENILAELRTVSESERVLDVSPPRTTKTTYSGSVIQMK